jgi:hypothetical protein
MVAVKACAWEEVSAAGYAPRFENPARQAWREAVVEVADKARATLPECHGRVDSAVKMVLSGDVELLADGKAKVASQSNGTTTYHVVNGECTCKDFPKAPQGFCKHRLAYGIHKRAYTLARAKLEQLGGAQNGTDHLQAEQPQVQPQSEAVSTLPEAPASCNVYVTLAGRKVQVTLRDSDEQRLLARLDTLLQRFPAEDAPQAEQAQPEGWCSKHGVQMKLRNGEHGSWWSHKTAQGWCKGT